MDAVVDLAAVLTSAEPTLNEVEEAIVAVEALVAKLVAEGRPDLARKAQTAAVKGREAVGALQQQLKMQQSVARIDHKEMEGIQDAMLQRIEKQKAQAEEQRQRHQREEEQRVAALQEQLKMQQSVARIDHKEMEGIQDAMLQSLDKQKEQVEQQQSSSQVAVLLQQLREDHQVTLAAVKSARASPVMSTHSSPGAAAYAMSSGSPVTPNGAFNRLDVNHDGVIDRHEFTQAVQAGVLTLGAAAAPVVAGDASALKQALQQQLQAWKTSRGERESIKQSQPFSSVQLATTPPAANTPGAITPPATVTTPPAVMTPPAVTTPGAVTPNKLGRGEDLYSPIISPHRRSSQRTSPRRTSPRRTNQTQHLADAGQVQQDAAHMVERSAMRNENHTQSERAAESGVSSICDTVEEHVNYSHLTQARIAAKKRFSLGRARRQQQLAEMLK